MSLINRVYKTKLLGVYIDDKLNCKEHINYISCKVSRSIGMIVKARTWLNKESLITLYYSFL